MGTTSEKLTYLNTTKGKIKDSINLTGANITTEPFRQYSTKLEDAYIDIINNGTDTLYNNFPKVSGEGTSLTLNNTYQAPMRNNLKGNTSQTGTPTPTSPIPVNVVSGDNEIQVWGKNILNTLYQHNAGDVVTTNGITFTFNQDGSIKLNGTATSNAYVMLYGELSQFSTTLFKLPNTFKASGGITYPIGILGRVTGSGTYQELRTATGGTEYGCVFLQVVSGQNVNTTIYPQIEKGSQATNYEPYQGNTYNIDLPVENLCNNDDILGLFLNFTNSTIGEADGSKTMYAKVPKNTELTVSRASLTNRFRIGLLNEIPQNGGTFYLAYNGDSSSDLSKTINSGNYEYVAVQYTNQGEDTNIQIEKGTKVNSFTPYGTTPIELCKIGNYQDYFGKSDGRNLFDKSKETINTIVNSAGTLSPNNDYNSSDYIVVNPSESVVLSTNTTSAILEIVEYDENKTLVNRGVKTNSNVYTLTTNASTHFVRISYQNTSTKTQFEKGNTLTPWQPYGVGKWYLHKEIGKVVLNGSENWVIFNSNNTRTAFRTDINDIEGYTNGNNTPNLLSNRFIPISYTGSWVVGKLSRLTQSNVQNVLIVIYNPNTRVEDFKTWLSTHNTSVYYVLATPTNTEITDTTLNNQLEELYIAKSKENQTNISQINNDLGFIISASALKKG